MSRTTVPLFDLPVRDEDVAAVESTLRSGWLTMGPQTQQFETAFAEGLGVEHAIAVGSGTAALHLAYLAAGVGPGDEVIVPAITFVATAAAVRYCGAVPVLADVVGPRDLGIDPESVARLLGPRTKAVCAVHYAGYPAAVEELETLCAAHGIALVEDAAHSPRAFSRDGRALGGIGLTGTFSFFSNKVLACGEGGLVATDDPAVADLARSRRSHAMTSGTWDRHRGHSLSYDVVATGFNYRIDELRAALLNARLPRLDADIEARRRLVRRYRAALEGVPGLIVPYEDEDVGRSSCYVMPLVLEEPAHQEPLRRSLKERWGVQTSQLYPAIHEFTAYSGSPGLDLRRSERIARTQVTIPLYPTMTDDDQDRVISALREELAVLDGSVRP